MRYERQYDDFSKKPEVEALMQLGDQTLAEMKITDSPQRDLFTVQEYARVLTHLRHAKRPPKFGVDLGDCLEEARLTVGVRQAYGQLWEANGTVPVARDPAPRQQSDPA